MRSYAHPVHPGAAAALVSAAPASAVLGQIRCLVVREPVLIRGSASIVNCCRGRNRQGFSSGVYVKPRISVVLGLGSRFRGCETCRCCGWGEVSTSGYCDWRCGRGEFGCVNWGWRNTATHFRAVVAMQKLLVATNRRITVDSKTGRPCLACRCSSSSRNGTGGEGYDKKVEQSPPQDAVLKAISEVSKAEGRVGKTTNMVIGGTVKEDAEGEWNVIDQKVNVYPMVRDFTAIGTGGDEFVQAMVEAVESITESPIPGGRVTKKLSSQGKYVSVKIGGIKVNSSEQVRAVYDAMRKDVRMKYFL